MQIYYSQHDVRWRHIALGASGKSIDRDGCLVCCLAMALSFYVDKQVTPLSIASLLSSKNGFDADGAVKWGILMDTFPAMQEALGFVKLHYRGDHYYLTYKNQKFDPNNP